MWEIDKVSAIVTPIWRWSILAKDYGASQISCPHCWFLLKLHMNHLIPSAADLPRPPVQWKRLLPSTTQHHGSFPAQRRNSSRAVARSGEPGPAGSEPEGLLYTAGSCEGVGPLDPLPLPQDLSASFLHWLGWAAGLHFSTDDQPRLYSSSSIEFRQQK